MRRHLIQLAAIVGPLIVIQTVVWEYARMAPTYQFIIEPWSIRGLDTVHGAIFASIGTALLVSALLVAWKRSTELAIGGAIVILQIVLAVGITAVFATDPMSVNANEVVVAILALLVAVILTRVVRDALTKAMPAINRSWASAALFLVLLLLGYLILNAALVGNSVSTSPAVVVGVAFLLLGGLAFSQKPRELAANRMFNFSTVFAWFAITLQAGAIRSTLLRFQLEQNGLSASYPDTQITAGWIISGFAMLITFVGAVGMWAKRRDEILTAQRAQRQREAAERSAAEIREAMETQGLLRT